MFAFTPNTAYYYHPPAASVAVPQPGEIPINPIPPIPVPLPMILPQPDFSVTAKRRRGDAEDAAAYAAWETEDSAPRKRAKGQDVIFRIVVPSRQIGKVIGKEGCRIQKIREDTKATIKSADAIALITGTQAGSLIGMSGQNIDKLRNLSGAMITVLAPNQLPLCASAHESDRVVQIAGDVPVVMKALEDIGCQLRDNPPRQVISISPTYNYYAIRPPQTFVDPTSGLCNLGDDDFGGLGWQIDQ